MQRSEAQWLDAIFEKDLLTPLFQPIVDAGNRTLFGYEALIRGPSDSPLHSPLTLFDAAARHGRLVDLDLLCRRLAITRFVSLDLPGCLFLNVLPNTIVERDFREGLTLRYLEQAGLAPQRVVIELTEHTPIHDYALMRQAVAHYRQMGFKVALDDLGAGYSGLRHWAELRPDFVKIDRHFIQNI
ncbi:EAL domain-containing protein [Litchfieldella xinjiangensis]|uniref:EAL domain-containing protein n=1 Tax=Litchfieldella xinjiangensis TaxID=1166948 RepID=UPI000A423DF2